MATIFQEGFSEEIFEQIIKEFLYADLRVTIALGVVNRM